MAIIPEIEEAIIYGSRARGDHKSTSDRDIFLEGSSLTIKYIVLLDERLDDLYLSVFFDTCILAHLKEKDLPDNIRRKGKTIYHQGDKVM